MLRVGVYLSACLMGLGLATLPAVAESSQEFTLHNSLGQPITHVYVSSPGDAVWGPDLNGPGPLEDGHGTKITFSGYDDTSCHFDVKVVTADRAGWVIKDLDLCATNDLTFKLHAGKVVYLQQ